MRHSYSYAYAKTKRSRVMRTVNAAAALYLVWVAFCAIARDAPARVVRVIERSLHQPEGVEVALAHGKRGALVRQPRLPAAGTWITGAAPWPRSPCRSHLDVRRLA